MAFDEGGFIAQHAGKRVVAIGDDVIGGVRRRAALLQR